MINSDKNFDDSVESNDDALARNFYEILKRPFFLSF